MPVDNWPWLKGKMNRQFLLWRGKGEGTLARMVLAKSGSGDLVVAYLPDDDSIELDLSTLARSVPGRWTNPKSGEAEPAVVAMTTRSARFVRPQGWEDALLVLRSH